MDKLDNDILVDGIIKYTKSNKLKWSKNNYKYYSEYKITEHKKISITIYDDFINVSIVNKDRIREYTNIHTNRLSELLGIIVE